MNSKERIKLTLVHQEPDRVPIMSLGIDNPTAEHVLGRPALCGFGGRGVEGVPPVAIGADGLFSDLVGLRGVEPGAGQAIRATKIHAISLPDRAVAERGPRSNLGCGVADDKLGAGRALAQCWRNSTTRYFLTEFARSRLFVHHSTVELPPPLES